MAGTLGAMPGDATAILKLIADADAAGDPETAARVAARELLPLVYRDLRDLAAAGLARESVPTIDATELVHEAWMRLVGPDGEDRRPDGDWHGRRHFVGAAAIAMRRILVDRARARRALKRGGNAVRIDLDSGLGSVAPGSSDELLDLDDALSALEQAFPDHAELVRLRIFLGLTIEGAAEVLGVSTNTVERRWAFARAWLGARLGADSTPPPT